MAQEVTAVKEAQRQAEFAEAKAEQLAIARGEALYRCQERLTEAQTQQVQLAEILKVTLDKLGMGLTPSPTNSLAPRELLSPGLLADRPAGPLFPPSSLEIPNGHRTASHSNHSPISESDTPLSGFTVYSNDLHDSPQVEAQSRPSHSGSERPDSGGSSTKWKDISEVATRASPTALPIGIASGQVPQQNHTAAGMAATANQHTLRNHMVKKTNTENMPPPPARCMDASQMDSLVRVGASLASSFPEASITQQVYDTLRSLESREKARPKPVAQQPQARTQKTFSATEVPAVRKPVHSGLMAGPPKAGPLSQASGWTSPGIHGADQQMTSIFNTNGNKAFYTPFSAAAAAPSSSGGRTSGTTSAAPSNETSGRVGQIVESKRVVSQAPGSMHAPPPRKSTFRLGQIPQMPVNGTNSVASSVASDGHPSGGTIKAVMPQQARQAYALPRSEQLHAALEYTGLPEDDKFARQRRAAERLSQKINSKLPPEYRTADPLGLMGPPSRPLSARSPTRSISAGSSAGSGRKKAPKGSLRRRAEESIHAVDALGIGRGGPNAQFGALGAGAMNLS